MESYSPWGHEEWDMTEHAYTRSVVHSDLLEIRKMKQDIYFSNPGATVLQILLLVSLTADRDQHSSWW